MRMSIRTSIRMSKHRRGDEFYAGVTVMTTADSGEAKYLPNISEKIFPNILEDDISE